MTTVTDKRRDERHNRVCSMRITEAMDEAVRQLSERTERPSTYHWRKAMERYLAELEAKQNEAA